MDQNLANSTWKFLFNPTFITTRARKLTLLHGLSTNRIFKNPKNSANIATILELNSEKIGRKMHREDGWDMWEPTPSASTRTQSPGLWRSLILHKIVNKSLPNQKFERPTLIIIIKQQKGKCRHKNWCSLEIRCVDYRR